MVTNSNASQPRNLLLWAPDRRYFEEEAKKWCASWGEDVAVLNAVDAEPSALLDELRSVPMWSSTKVVRLTNAQGAPAPLLSTVREYLESPSSKAVLLLEYEGTLDYRSPAAWKGLQKEIDVRRCTPSSVEEVIRKIAGKHGLKVKPESVSAIKEWSRGDLAMVASAMDLLTLYRAGDDAIEAEDVARLLGAGGTPQVWDLLDALTRGDRGRFSSLLHQIEEDGGTEPLSVVGMVAWQIRQLLLLAGCRAAGIKDSDIISNKKLQEIKSRGQLSKASGLLSKWKEPELRKALGILYELDLSLKGSQSEPWALLENHLLKLLP